MPLATGTGAPPARRHLRTCGPSGLPSLVPLIVMQGEVLAVLDGFREGFAIGSDAATTCLLVATVADDGRRAAALAHVDDAVAGDEAAMEKMTDVLVVAETCRVALVGAYAGGAASSRTNVDAVLRAMHAHERTTFVLDVFCVLEDNTDAQGKPLHQAMHVRWPLNGEPNFCAGALRDSPPAEFVRHARYFVRGGPRPVVVDFDASTCTLRIPGVPRGAPTPRERAALLFLHDLEDDGHFLEYTSTSPDAELPGYVAAVRGAIAYLLGRPPDGADGRSHMFAWDETARAWVPTDDAPLETASL